MTTMTITFDTLGDRLRKARENVGLHQADAAEYLTQAEEANPAVKTGCSPPTVSNWENPDKPNEPKANQLRLLARLYQTTVYELLGLPVSEQKSTGQLAFDLDLVTEAHDNLRSVGVDPLRAVAAVTRIYDDRPTPPTPPPTAPGEMAA